MTGQAGAPARDGEDAVRRCLVVDAHQHFWDPARAEYPWMTEELAPIRRRFGPEHLRPLLAERGVDRTVLVQTRSSLEETREFLAVAAETDFVAGVVGWVDLTDPGVAQTLRHLRSAPGGEKLAGIRHQVHDEPDPEWLLRSDVRRGLEAVGGAGLAYDLLVRTRELEAALRTARALPEVRFVIDHVAKPPIRTGENRAWAEAMAPFSECPNVSCKLSGMVTEADWARWRPDDLVPYVRRVLGWFGEDRLMFGSDWPVCLVAASYTQVLDALLYALDDLPHGARAKILGANAVRFYRLGLPEHG
jgi:L-fuconolactonase